MFIRFIKEISLKKILKSNLQIVKPTTLQNQIQTVALIVDESYFEKKEQLILELVNLGLQKNNIKTIVFNNNAKSSINDINVFSNKDVSWKGEFKEVFINEFILQPFDMLISYYDVEKAPLLLLTHHSKALFKVGLSTVDKRLNHLMINTKAENYQVFAHELFRYLKILNKI